MNLGSLSEIPSFLVYICWTSGFMYVSAWIKKLEVFYLNQMHDLFFHICLNRLHGTPRNPYNVNYYTGGSSSGSAVVVAAGIPVKANKNYQKMLLLIA